jgi:hypothetical protein
MAGVRTAYVPNLGKSVTGTLGYQSPNLGKSVTGTLGYQSPNLGKSVTGIARNPSIDAPSRKPLMLSNLLANYK